MNPLIPFPVGAAGGGGGTGGSGVVTGPASSTDTAIARFDGAGGKTLKNSSVTINDSGAIAGATSLEVGGITVASGGLTIEGATADAFEGSFAFADPTADWVWSWNSAGIMQGSYIELAHGTGANFYADSSVTLTVNRGGAGFSLGVYNSDDGVLLVENSGSSSGTVMLGSSVDLTWGTGSAGTLEDTGLARNAAGVIKATDGSTGIRGFIGGGASVASATELPLPTGRVFRVTGTTNIESIAAGDLQDGVVITLIFDDALTFTKGGNLKLASSFVTSVDATITLAYDGTSFVEVCRSVN